VHAADRRLHRGEGGKQLQRGLHGRLVERHAGLLALAHVMEVRGCSGPIRKAQAFSPVKAFQSLQLTLPGR